MLNRLSLDINGDRMRDKVIWTETLAYLRQLNGVLAGQL